MKEITRIHLAKTPYEVELAAKTELEAYERALKRHLEDETTLDDIEVRMCELLTGRGVEPNGVIGVDDVQAIRAQLGEPSDFGDERHTLTTSDEKPAKRLYRDLDNAMLGGVMSGIAAYFNIDPTLVRVIGIILTMVSFGSFVFAYILLWLLVPAAKTASQKLELAGKPITLENINKSGESTLSMRARTIRRVFMVGGGMIAVTIALAALGLVVAVCTGAIPEGATVAMPILPLIALVTAGISFVMFMLVIAYGLFRQTWRQQFSIALGILTLIGFISFGAGIYKLRTEQYIGDFTFEQPRQSEQYQVSGLEHMKHLVIDSTVPVYYTAGEQTVSVVSSKSSRPEFVIEGDTATLRYTENGGIITMTGPALDSVDVVRYSFGYTANGGNLSLDMNQSTTATVEGSLTTLQVALRGNGAVFTGKQLAVDTVTLIHDAKNVGEALKAEVDLSTVRSLDVTYPTACADNTGLVVSVQNVTGQIHANSKLIQMPFATGCFSLVKAPNEQ